MDDLLTTEEKQKQEKDYKIWYDNLSPDKKKIVKGLDKRMKGVTRNCAKRRLDGNI